MQCGRRGRGGSRRGKVRRREGLCSPGGGPAFCSRSWLGRASSLLRSSASVLLVNGCSILLLFLSRKEHVLVGKALCRCIQK